MEFILAVNKNSTDKRVMELEKLCVNHKDGKKVYFVEPRAGLPENAHEFDYVFGYAKDDSKNYVCLSDDEKFIEENNYFTAIAMKEILVKRFGAVKQKMLIMGYGKLTEQLEKVFTEAEIHILNFNHHKVADLDKKYGRRAYFEKAPLEKFPIIVNTIPKQVVGAAELKRIGKKTAIYDLASSPFGFDFGKLDKSKFDYNIEPGLPGRFYPDRAAKTVYDCIIRFFTKHEKPKKAIALCLTGSPCSYAKLMPALTDLCSRYKVIPVMTANAGQINRFLDIEEFKTRLKEMTGNNIITTIAGSETFSSMKDVVASVVAPATGNTIAKLANAVTNTSVCMAVKALLRNSKPCIMGISTNDALSGNAANIGVLLNRKGYYFVPFRQDDPVNKPFSMLCDFSRVCETIEAALEGKQIQPIITI